MLILTVQPAIPPRRSDMLGLNVILHMFIRSLILKGRVEDLQLGVESYQKKLNITKPQKTFLGIEFKEPYTPSYDPPGIVVRIRSKIENKGKVPAEMELVLEQTQQDNSYEVSADTGSIHMLSATPMLLSGIEDSHHGPKHQSDIKVITMMMEILPEPTSNKLYDAPVMRTASTAVKPCQEDFSEFYLITGTIYTDQRGTMVIATVFDEVTKTLSSISVDYH
ncbi:hypothetical protein Tco_0717848 [Tanacetum coccineum]